MNSWGAEKLLQVMVGWKRSVWLVLRSVFQTSDHPEINPSTNGENAGNALPESMCSSHVFYVPHLLRILRTWRQFRDWHRFNAFGPKGQHGRKG